MAYEEFLARVPLFEHCTPEELSAIAAAALQSAYEPAQIIVTQGTPGQAFYLITAGAAEVSRDGKSLATLSPGEFFGEMSLLDSAPRSATIKAVAHTECLMISSWDFKRLLQDHPSIAIKLLEVLSRRLRVADERLSR